MKKQWRFTWKHFLAIQRSLGLAPVVILGVDFLQSIIPRSARKYLTIAGPHQERRSIKVWEYCQIQDMEQVGVYSLVWHGHTWELRKIKGHINSWWMLIRNPVSPWAETRYLRQRCRAIDCNEGIGRRKPDHGKCTFNTLVDSIPCAMESVAMDGLSWDAPGDIQHLGPNWCIGVQGLHVHQLLPMLRKDSSIPDDGMILEKDLLPKKTSNHISKHFLGGSSEL